MTARSLMILAAAGSAALLLGAYTFQALGYAPCKLCLWQRWPHGVAILVGVVAIFYARAVTAVVGALAALTTAGFGIYHTGVERGWWEGPSSCSGGGDLSGLSGADMLSTETLDKVVMCDEVAWAFAGLSMASWNAVASFALACIWAAALVRTLR
ncbi:Disulfide bond formation protein DsbB [Palleronia marisminoris]|uniref:Disulfide bond formation protein B n=2 Tax=Palleronia marisminoris TaxID=315423 RepID=A0A1Y5TCA8_9RHOB|nr:disulfide bond formation protein B [Palleronia marisminoris]SFH33489.1 Disulfide bond formation protein DsbB [Palleronia marisminoris]SLN60498.1 disulfide bond formation protein B [Palleronia marisminoris]